MARTRTQKREMRYCDMVVLFSYGTTAGEILCSHMSQASSFGKLALPNV
jgi:hypothetical protein